MRKGRAKKAPHSAGRARSTARPRPAAVTPVGLEARDRAFRLISAQAAVFPEMPPGRIDEAGLSARDAALAHSIAEGAARYWRTLTWLLELFLKSPLHELEPAMRAVLLGGAAQIVIMDRIPVHAALDTSVEWAKRAVRAGAGGMVNAVLRRVASLARASPSGERTLRDAWTAARDEIPLADGSALLLGRAVLPEPTAERLAIATSHPPWLIERWTRRFHADLHNLAHHSLVQPPVLLNTAHAGVPVEPSEHLHPHRWPSHTVATGPRPWLAALLDARRDVWVQDPASSLAVADIAGLAPKLVLDLCAGQGTKTRQLAATFPGATIVASDPDDVRSGVLREVFAASSQVVVRPPDEVRRSCGAKADLILLDVPCSNTGVLARRVEAKYRCGPAQLARLVSIQRAIVADAIPLLAPGGTMLYSTCSLDDEENRGIASWAQECGLVLEQERLTLPSGRPGDHPAGYHDGSYSALFSRAKQV